MAFGSDESVLFIELSLIQGCPYREVPLCTHTHIHMYVHVLCVVLLLVSETDVQHLTDCQAASEEENNLLKGMIHNIFVCIQIVHVNM